MQEGEGPIKTCVSCSFTPCIVRNKKRVFYPDLASVKNIELLIKLFTNESESLATHLVRDNISSGRNFLF